MSHNSHIYVTAVLSLLCCLIFVDIKNITLPCRLHLTNYQLYANTVRIELAGSLQVYCTPACFADYLVSVFVSATTFLLSIFGKITCAVTLKLLLSCPVLVFTSTIIEFVSY